MRTFICVILFVISFTVCSAERMQVENTVRFEYEITDDGIIITGYTGTSTDIIIPSEVGGYPVVGIADYAFADSQLKNVVIEEGVHYIGAFAFNCQLESVKLPETLIMIGEGAFSATRLKEIYIPDSVAVIERWAFAQSSIQYVHLPKSIAFLPEVCFFECMYLKEINIPSNVLSIGERCFYYCKELEQVQFAQGIKVIGRDNFCDCTQLTEIHLPEGLIVLMDGCFAYCHSLKDVHIPSSLLITSKEPYYEEQMIFIDNPCVLFHIHNNSSFEKWSEENGLAFVREK